MKKIYIIFFCLFVIVKTAFAQTGNTNADLLLDSSRHYIYSNQQKALFYTLQLLNTAKNTNNKSAQAYSYHLLGVIDEQIGANENALKNFNTAIELAKQAKDIKAQLKVMIALSNYYINRTNFTSCIELCHQGIKESIAINDHESTASFYHNLSLAFTYMEDYDNAIKYGNKSIELKKKLPSKENLANAYLNRGIIYTNKGDYLAGFKDYTKAEKIFLKTQNHIALTQTYINFGWDYTDLKKFSLARNYLKKAMTEADKSNEKIRQSGVWNALGHYYQNRGYTDSIAIALQMGLQLSLDAGNNRNALIAYQKLSEHYKKSNNNKEALEYLQKAYALKDTILNEEKQKKTQLLNTRYESEQKEEQIKLLNTQQENDGLIIQRQRWTLFSILLLIVIIFILTYIFFNNYRKKQLTRKEQELQSQKEAERIRIARDMHDEIGAGLTRIVMRSEQVKLQLKSGKELKNGIVESLEKMASESRLLSHNIGEIIWSLNPKNDSFDNLFAYIRNYAYDFLEEANIDCKIHFPDNLPVVSISPELRRNVFLIIKESLNNIVKHSEATEVEITLLLSSNHFSLSIKDNGKGIIGDEFQTNGNGLGNMKKRTEERVVLW